MLPTDWAPPVSAVLARVPDPRAVQYWDHDRLLSHRLGEHDKKSIVWDWVAIYAPGERWEQSPPQPIYSGRPAVEITADFEKNLAVALNLPAVPLQ